MAKISLSAIKLRAGDIASVVDRDRMAITQDLIDAHVRHGIEIDHDDSAESQELNFAGGFDPNKTQPIPVKEKD